jgi:hypothetical protein
MRYFAILAVFLIGCSSDPSRNQPVRVVDKLVYSTAVSYVIETRGGVRMEIFSRGNYPLVGEWWEVDSEHHFVRRIDFLMEPSK